MAENGGYTSLLDVHLEKLDSPMARSFRAWSEDIEMVTPAASMGSRPTSESQGTMKQAEARKGLYSRAFAPLTAGGIRQSTFTLVQTALGGGVLTISYMLLLSGLGLGSLLLLFSGIVAFVSMQILMRAAVLLQTFTISGLLAACLGPRSGMLLDLSLFLYGNGSLVTYLIFLGDFVPSIILDLQGGLPSWCSSEAELRSWCLVGATIIATPLIFPKDLSALRFISPIALSGLVYTVILVWIKCPVYYAMSDQTVEYFKLDGNIFKCFSMCVFAYNCHINVIPVAKELQNSTDKRIAKTTFRVAYVQLIFYMMMAIGGYLSFCAKTPQNLLTGYPDADPWVLASRVLLSITILACLPINVNPTVRSVLCLLELAFPGLREQAPMPSNNNKKNMSSIPSETEVQALRSYPFNRDGLRQVLSFGCLLFTLSAALKFKDLAQMVSFLGATVGTLMMMVIPALLVQVGCPEMFPDRFTRVSVTLLLTVSALCSLASLVV